MLGRSLDEFFRSTSTRVVVDEIRIEDQALGLIFDRLNDSRMRMSRRNNRVAAVEVEISLAVSGVDPNVLASLDHEGKLLVCRDLILLFDVDQTFKLWLCAQIYSPLSQAHEHGGNL